MSEGGDPWGLLYKITNANIHWTDGVSHYHEYPRTVSVMLNVTLMAMCKGWLVQLECFWLEGYVYLRTIGYSLKNIGTIYIFTTTCCIKYIREKCSPTNNIYITWNKMITKSCILSDTWDIDPCRSSITISANEINIMCTHLHLHFVNWVHMQTFDN